MPDCPDESLSSAHPSTSDADPSSFEGLNRRYSASQREPPGSQGPAQNSGITFASQDKLPKLPIPDLKSTCMKYLDALKPLQNKQEQQDTASTVQDFLNEEGPKLQKRLKRYATGKTSYIEQFCRFTPSLLGLDLEYALQPTYISIV